jgi:hypothetical protein
VVQGCGATALTTSVGLSPAAKIGRAEALPHVRHVFVAKGLQQPGGEERAMADRQDDRRDRDEWDDVTKRLDVPDQDTIVRHGGQELPDELQDRPEQNVGYDEAVKGAPLTPDERRRSEEESPLKED